MAKPTVLSTVVIAAPAMLALLALFVYTPLPEEVEDRYRAMLHMTMDSLLNHLPFKVTESLGYGDFFDFIPFMQRRARPDLNTPPRTSANGDMRVSRTGLAGRTVIIYRPIDLTKDELLPGLIYLHGGGWVLQNPDLYDRSVHSIANCTRKITISVDYRKSPGHPFPAPVNDCLDVTRHVLKHGKTLGIDVNRLGIAGDEAGGNLAAAVALRLSNEKSSGLPALKFQALLWPPLQAMDFQTPSYTETGEAVSLLGRQRMIGYWALYLGLEPAKVHQFINVMAQNRHVTTQVLQNSKYSEYIDVQNLPEKFQKPRKDLMPANQKDASKPAKGSGSKLSPMELRLFNRIKHHLTNPLLSPLMAPDLSGLPSTMILVAEFDILRDEGLQYAHRLRQSGVQTQVHIGKGFHGDFHTYSYLPEFLHSKTGQQSVQTVCDFLEREA